MSDQIKYCENTFLTKWKLSPEESASLDLYLTRICDYWQLVDRLIEGFGDLKFDGQIYETHLVGKGRHDLQERAMEGKIKSGKFILSYRAIGDDRVCLVREKFVCQD